MTRSGEPKFSYYRFSQGESVCAALQGSLTLEGLLHFYEARRRVGKLESVADHIGKAAKAATSLITVDEDTILKHRTALAPEIRIRALRPSELVQVVQAGRARGVSTP